MSVPTTPATEHADTVPLLASSSPAERKFPPHTKDSHQRQPTEFMDVKDDMFYFSSLHVQLSDEAVVVPRDVLYQRSAVIKTLLSNSSGHGIGSSFENPLKLEWMQKEQFGVFMNVLLGYAGDELSSDSWISVLKIARRLEIMAVCDQAVAKLDVATIPPHVKVMLAHDFNVEKWRRTAYEEVIKAYELKVDDAEIIGWSCARRLARLRETKYLLSYRLKHNPVPSWKDVLRRLAPFGFGKNLSAICPGFPITDVIYPTIFVEYPPYFNSETLDNAYKEVFGDLDESNTTSRALDAERVFNTSYLVISVGGKLFRVPRDIFEEGSSAFAVRYDVNEHTGSETTPVVVDDVEVNDLKSFLKCATNSISGNEDMGVFVATLKLSNMWRCRKPRNFAIAKLEGMGMDPVTQANLAREHDVPYWLWRSMMILALRKVHPTEDECAQIGWPNTILLFQLREKLLPERFNVLRNDLNRTFKTYGTERPPVTCKLCNSLCRPNEYSIESLGAHELDSVVKTLVADEFFDGLKDLKHGTTDSKDLSWKRRHLRKKN